MFCLFIYQIQIIAIYSIFIEMCILFMFSLGHSAHGPYGDEVEEMDWSVGQILSALEKFDFMNNTIVYFSSDNGGHIEEHHGIHGYRTGGHNGIFRGTFLYFINMITKHRYFRKCFMYYSQNNYHCHYLY